MSDNPLQKLAAFDQSPWYDNIQRSLIKNGELTRLINEDGLKGMTSNPTIFEKAIAGSDDYEHSISQLLQHNPNIDSKDLFYHLAIEDIQAAADAFHGVYEASNGKDGYVSIEVSPTLARDTAGTIAEARELAKRIDRPNLMIKVPATVEGLPAVETLISEGISVNVTLLFSVERYKVVIEAYLRGLEQGKASGNDLSKVASVASFFVSRVDSAIDKQLQQAINSTAAGNGEKLASLLSRSAISNAKIAYQAYKDIYNSPRFAELKAANAQPQRLLWASTGTKNPELSDVLYIEELIGHETVSTIPPATYNAFKNHGQLRVSLEENHAEAYQVIDALKEAGIDLKATTDELEEQGVKLFADSFNSLLDAISAKKSAMPLASNS